MGGKPKMKNGFFSCLVLGVAALVGYTIITRTLEEQKDFR